MAESEIGHNSDDELEIDKDEAIKLLEDIANAEAGGQLSRVELANLYKKAEKDLGLHRGAVKHVRKLQKLTAIQRKDFWRTEQALIDHLDLADNTKDLFDDEESDEGANVDNFEDDETGDTGDDDDVSDVDCDDLTGE